MSKPIRVLIADDHELIRKGISTVLGPLSEIEVVGEASDGAEAVRLTESLRPDVVLMDLNMPEVSGAEAIARIQDLDPAPKVIVLTMFDTDEYIFPAFEAGADAYILKESSRGELIDAVKAAAEGDSPIDPRIAARVLHRLNNQSAPDPATELSEREIEVLQLAAEGARNKEIGEKLFISENTIKSHFRRIFEKLGVQDRTQAVAEAARKGVIDL